MKETKKCFWGGFFPKIDGQQRTAALTGLIVMVITHLYMFTNKIVNHDDVNRMLVGDTDEIKIQHGRWAGIIFDRVSGSTVSIPYIIGGISILAVMGVCIMMVSVLDIQRTSTTILLCALLCTFPASANIFLYTYIADVYFISMFMAVWGIWLLLQDGKACKSCSVLLLTLACGCYQAFWCFGMGILFVYMLVQYWEHAREDRIFFKSMGQYLAISGISLVLYMAINRIVQAVSGAGATDYMGLNSMGDYGGIGNFLKVVVGAYCQYVQFYYLDGYFTHSVFMSILNIVLTVWVLFLLFVKGEKEGRRGFVLVICCFTVLIPGAFNLVSVASRNQLTALMKYGFVLSYVLCLVLMERLGRKSRVKGKASMVPVCAAAYVVMCLTAYKGYITDNEIYFRQQLNYEATYSYTLRLLYRLEAAEDYRPGMLVGIVNETPQVSDHVAIMMENYPEEMQYFDYLNGMVGSEPRTFVKRANDIADFCKYYHGYDMKLVDMDSLPRLTQTEEFQEMPVYPQEGSMRVIEGVMMIKLPDGKQD